MVNCCRFIKILIAFSFIPVSLYAQYADEEYRMEIGARLGGISYMGDANGNPFKEMGISAGVLARYNFNPRMVIKADFGIGKISGNTHSLDNTFPNGGQVDFERTIYDFGTQFEYNFWPYGNGMSYQTSRRFTPYILGGIGMTFASEPVENIAAFHFALGAGIKYKFAPRWNVGVEFAVRFTTTDDLDVTSSEGLVPDDPYQIKSGFMKNKDCYSLLGLTVTYDIWAKCNNCNKD